MIGNTLYCSFCGKSQHEVRKLVSGPNVLICDECIVLSVRLCIQNTPVTPMYPDLPVTAADLPAGLDAPSISPAGNRETAI